MTGEGEAKRTDRQEVNGTDEKKEVKESKGEGRGTRETRQIKRMTVHGVKGQAGAARGEYR